MKILKDLSKVKPNKFVYGVLNGNKSGWKPVLELGKRTTSEIVEETSIESLHQLSNGLILGDDVDFSQLDDVAVTSIISSAGSSAPSIAYSKIMEDVGIKKYKNQLKKAFDIIDGYKSMLNAPLSDTQRSAVHNKINNLVEKISGLVKNAEADVVLLGGKKVGDLLTYDNLMSKLLKQAGVERTDSPKQIDIKLKKHRATLSKQEAAEFQESINVLSDAKAEIMNSIDYTNAVDEVFGDKGAEVKESLDTEGKTDQEVYTEVYEILRNEINEGAEIEQATFETDTKEDKDGDVLIAGVRVKMPTEKQKAERKSARTKPKYVEDSVAELKEEDIEQLKEELDGEFGILTGENPEAQPLTEEENASLNKKAWVWLKQKGYTPRRLTGKYGTAENSYFVPNLSLEHAVEFAKTFNQESVAHSEGLVFQDGTAQLRIKGDDNFTFKNKLNKKTDNVSVVKTKDGAKTFEVGYDWSGQPRTQLIEVVAEEAKAEEAPAAEEAKAEEAPAVEGDKAEDSEETKNEK